MQDCIVKHCYGNDCHVDIVVPNTLVPLHSSCGAVSHNYLSNAWSYRLCSSHPSLEGWQIRLCSVHECIHWCTFWQRPNGPSHSGMNHWSSQHIFLYLQEQTLFAYSLTIIKLSLCANADFYIFAQSTFVHC